MSSVASLWLVNGISASSSSADVLRIELFIAHAEQLHLLFQRAGDVVDLRVAGAPRFDVALKLAAAEHGVGGQRDVGKQNEQQRPGDRTLRGSRRHHGMNGRQNAERRAATTRRRRSIPA